MVYKGICKGEVKGEPRTDCTYCKMWYESIQPGLVPQKFNTEKYLCKVATKWTKHDHTV